MRFETDESTGKIRLISVDIPWQFKSAKNNRMGRVIPKRGREGKPKKTKEDFMVLMQKTNPLERDEDCIRALIKATVLVAQGILPESVIGAVAHLAGSYRRKEGLGKAGFRNQCNALGLVRPVEPLFGDDQCSLVIDVLVEKDALRLTYTRLGAKPKGRTGRRRDIQNFFDLACDMANGIIYDDDRCLSHVEAKKIYG